MKRAVALFLCLIVIMLASAAPAEEVGGMKPGWWKTLDIPQSKTFHLDKPMTVKALGLHFNQYPKEFDGCYFFPAIEKMTGVHFDIDWRVDDDGIDEEVQEIFDNAEGDVSKLPDIVNTGMIGIAEMANKGLIIPLDDYLGLIPNIIEKVGKDRMTDLVSADGHIYAIPKIVEVPGSLSVMVRKDWLDKLGMDIPKTWEDWKKYWYAVRDNDMNGNGDKTDEIPLVLDAGLNGDRCLQQLMNAFGIRTTYNCQFCITDDGKYTMVYEHPRFPEFLKEVRQLYKDGILDPDFAKRKQDDLFILMDGDRCGSTATWAEHAQASTNVLRGNGVKNALWECVPPIKGPHGDQLIPERQEVSRNWCITAAADKAGKTKDILRFFNWLFSREGIDLYSYGIEGQTYKTNGEKRVLNPDIVKNGFADYRSLGLQYEPFGGLWETSAFLQCMFGGEEKKDLNDAQLSFYRGVDSEGVNKGFYYSQPLTLETEAYVRHRPKLILGPKGVCHYRNQCIKGKIGIEDFYRKYRSLKDKGLNDVISQGSEAYGKMMRLANEKMPV